MCKEQAVQRREVRQVRMSDGEILYLLARADTGVPDPYVTRYVIAVVRQTGMSSGTIRGVLNGLRTGLDLLDDWGIDLEERIASGRFFDIEELGALATGCRARQDGKGIVDPAYAAGRFWSFTDYVTFRTDEVVCFAERTQKRHIASSLARFQKKAKRMAPKPGNGAARNEKEGLEPSLRPLLLKVIKPSDPGNPFRPKLRIRNHAMILLSFVHGFRAGEELGLKGKDYVTRSEPATITVHRRPDDPDDDRREPALAKTLSRTLNLDGEARRAMDAWIRDRQDRRKFPLARKHPYIFVSTTGAKLTLRSARDVYGRLRSAYPELAGVTQHILRHDANDRWVEHDEENKADPDASRQDQCYAMGWSSTSRQPDRYAKAAIRRRTNKRLAEMQRSMTQGDD